MSFSNPSASSQAGGLPASNPEAVLNELKRSAERKASLKMFYAAADLFRDYKGPFGGETAAERERLAADYEQQGRTAEKQRLERGAIPIPPRPAPSSRPPASGATVPREKPPVVIHKPSSAPPHKPAPAARQQPPIEGPSVTWTCRWCNEKVSVAAAQAGKLVPCPKCNRLVRAPKS